MHLLAYDCVFGGSQYAFLVLICEASDIINYKSAGTISYSRLMYGGARLWVLLNFSDFVLYHGTCMDVTV